MKKIRNPFKRHQDPELDISSLIDVSFLLLIFFLVTSTLLKTERDLALDLPEPRGTKDFNEPIGLAIAGDGTVTIGGQEFAGPSDGEPGPVSELQQELLRIKDQSDLIGEEVLVSVKSADDTKTQRFIEVLNALKFAKIERVALTDSLASN